MPNNQVSDPITDQEIAFAHLVLSGTMTDRQAAEAAGLSPDTAAYTKAKPRVRDYMLEHRAAVREQLVQQEAERLRQRNIARERALTRLWEIANMSPELTRNSVTGQVKALSIIVAIEGFIPDRRAASSAEKQSPTPPPRPNTYRAAWLPERQGETYVAQPSPDLVRDEDPDPAPNVAADAPSDPSPIPDANSSEVIPVHPVAETTPSSPYARVPDSAPDNRLLPLHMQMNRFGRRR